MCCAINKATFYHKIAIKLPQANSIYCFLTHNQYQMKSISDCFFYITFLNLFVVVVALCRNNDCEQAQNSVS